MGKRVCVSVQRRIQGRSILCRTIHALIGHHVMCVSPEIKYISDTPGSFLRDTETCFWVMVSNVP